ncbi:tetratricopeptide repeat protein [Sulfurimonas sp.]
MAKANDDIIIIEDSDAVLDSETTQESILDFDAEEEAKKKKIILFGGIAIIVVLLIIVSILLVLFKKSQEKISDNFASLDKKLEAPRTEVLQPTKLESMIAKANYLYTNDSKEKALNLYEKIAQYSKAISEYNLGVAQLKGKQYKIALKTFQKAIQNNEKRCVSAINAAVCSLHLKDKESFKYYLDLAYAYLPYEVNSPLYSYYYTLINYYNKNYLSALNSLTPSSSYVYPEIQNHLSAKINALYNNNYDAIDALEKISDTSDTFSLGLLYARIGDFSLAINHLEDAIVQNIEPVKAQLALGLINLKAGHIQTAAREIKNVTDMFPKQVYKPYPIKVKLKDSLFDSQKAQTLYRSKIIKSQNVAFAKIFYFSPYKIFNANQTISYIRKGNANIYIDNVQSAQTYLKRSTSSSSVNAGLTKAIKEALSLQIREANQDLQKLVKLQPKHSILQYNLALTYAQLGDIKKANEHFLRSYYLDAKNYLSAIYAVMTGNMINKDTKKLKSIISDSISEEKESEETDLYKTLLHISSNNYLADVDWLDNTYKQRPLYLMLSTLIGIKLNQYQVAQKAASKLTAQFPNDILPHLLYIDTHFYDYKPAKYAEAVIKYLKKQKFTFNDLYYGPFITRYLYIQENLITGQLYYLRKQLENKLDTTDKETYEIESSLALASLYDKHFEESYTLYNHLIDELKVRDAYTLYLAAVASTAANHHANAIALLELSKMKDKSFYESRYALALLYMEIQNNEGATIQLEKIKDDSFSSEYFEFNIDEDKLLYQKQNPQKG